MQQWASPKAQRNTFRSLMKIIRPNINTQLALERRLAASYECEVSRHYPGR